MRNTICDIKCPYYITGGERYITCEGIYGDIIKQRFNNTKQIDVFEKNNCFAYPNQCFIAKELDRKYEDI